VFTRVQLAIFLAVAMVAAFAAAFGLRTPPLPAQAAYTGGALEPLGERLNAMRQTLSDMERTSQNIGSAVGQAGQYLVDTRSILSQMTAFAAAEKAKDEEHAKAVDQLLANSRQTAKETKDALDTILSKMLGDPIGQTFGQRATIKVFSLKEAGYRGYMAKVKLHDPSAVRLVLAQDKVGSKGETTSQAAKRTGAKLAINGGGFTWQDGLIYPIGITVVDGVIKTFYQTTFSFIGFNKNGNLVGGEVTTEEQIKKMNVMHGASFLPTLLKDGKKQPIPSGWKNKKEPRTLIGHFSNGDLLFIVIDGRQKGYSDGVTLEEAQEKLLEFNVRDAYNLDGGGSSTFYYNGKVLNSPSDGKERLLASSFVVIP
jgi:exopolysaccharide biosynthesis protein